MCLQRGATPPAMRGMSGAFPACKKCTTQHPLRCMIKPVRIYVILDERSSATNPLGEAVETFIRREDAERFLEDVRGDDPELASSLRIEEHERQAG